MTDHDFIAAMKAGIPALPVPAPLAPPEILKGNADVAINHPDAVGADQDHP